METFQPELESSMLHPSSAESLDTAQPDYQSAAAEVASSLTEHNCTVLKLDEQSVFQMEAAQTSLKEVFEAKDAIYAAQLGAAFKHTSGFVYLPEHDAAVPESAVSWLSKVCLLRSLLVMCKLIHAELYSRLLQAFQFLQKTATDVLKTLTVPKALGMGPTAFDSLLDDTSLQPNQASASRLSITPNCNIRGPQPSEEEGLLTLIFIDQLAGLQVRAL